MKRDRALMLEVPENLVELLGSPEVVAARAKESLVLDLLLLREGCITPSRAAWLLDLPRQELLDLIVERGIHPAAESEEEIERERLLGMEHRGEIRLRTGKLPDDFWALPRGKDPTGLTLKALLEEREQGW